VGRPISRTGTLISWYINGILSNTSSAATIGTNFNSTSNILIGKSAWGTTHQFAGKIGDVRIYNRVLSSAEVTQNFNATKSRFGL
jgi:hypothetical protein